MSVFRFAGGSSDAVRVELDLPESSSTVFKRLQHRLRDTASSCKRHTTFFFAGDFKVDTQAVSGENFFHPICPLDEADSIAGHVLVGSKFEKLVDIPQAVGIEVVHGQPTFVFLNQDKSRAVHRFSRYVESFSGCLHESSFSSTQVSDQGDDQPRQSGFPDGSTQPHRCGFTGQFNR